MKTNNILAELKHAAGNVKWSHKNGKFIAIFGGRGIATEIGPEWKNYQIRTKAWAIQKELIDAKKGDLNAETEELWDRKTGKRVVTGAALGPLGQNRK